MKYIRISYRFIALLGLSVIGVILMLVYAPRKKSGEKLVAINQKQKNLRQWWLKKVVTIVGIKLKMTGDAHQQSALWVANHVSWLDIPVIGSAGATFLSKAEVRKWPVIGWLGEKVGTVFIQRGGKDASKKASAQISETVKSGDNILIFPEGTTGNGRDLRHFHARIFAPAIDHQLPVQPIAIRYLDDEGKPHPNIVWEDESFLRNLMNILAEKNIHVELTFFPVIQGRQFTQRKQIAEYAEKQIREVVESNKLG